MAVQIGFPRRDSTRRISGREYGHRLRQAGLAAGSRTAPCDAPGDRSGPCANSAPSGGGGFPVPAHDGAGSDDQSDRRQALGRHRPREQRQPRPVRPCQTRMSARLLTLSHSELMTQQKDLGVHPHHSRRDKPSSDTPRATVKKIRFNPTSRRSSHALAGGAGKAASETDSASDQVALVLCGFRAVRRRESSALTGVFLAGRHGNRLAPGGDLEDVPVGGGVVDTGWRGDGGGRIVRPGQQGRGRGGSGWRSCRRRTWRSVGGGDLRWRDGGPTGGGRCRGASARSCRGHDQPHHGEAPGGQRPGEQRQPRTVRPRQT